jgi:hypothetical protein
MSYYTVVRPCVVGQLHYTSVPVQPIEVADEVAEPLVAAGDLAPYRPGEPASGEADPDGGSPGDDVPPAGEASGEQPEEPETGEQRQGSRRRR